jgi:predicted Zn-dependent protease
MTRSRFQAALAAALALFLAACEAAPITGRNQLILLPESQDAEMGLQAYQQIKDERKVSNDPALNRRIREVGSRIARISPHPDWDWEFTLFDDDTPNAFALPGGKVGVHTGLFKVAKNDDQLATVMGHEVAHAIARHGAERVSQGMAAQFGGAAVGVATGNQAYVAGYSALAQLGLLGYSRTQESEADHIGLIYMAEAGYDPRAAVALWENMAALSQGGRPPEFLSTHPSEGNRIERLQQLMPEALEIYQGRTS